MRTLDKIITNVNTKYGAPMGRGNVGRHPGEETKVYDCKVPLNYGGYDKGGVYWGNGAPLRVQYTKDLSFIRFYRQY